MSYGVWKKRGKGWSSFEIDGCDDWRWDQMPESRSRHLKKRARRIGLDADWSDPSYVVWHLGQHVRGRRVEQVRTNSDHALYISYADEDSKEKALRANGYLTVDGKRMQEDLEFS